jgi:hypothetical protein
VVSGVHHRLHSLLGSVGTQKRNSLASLAESGKVSREVIFGLSLEEPAEDVSILYDRPLVTLQPKEDPWFPGPPWGGDPTEEN